MLELLGTPDLTWSGTELTVSPAAIQEAKFFLYTWESVKGNLLLLGRPAAAPAVGKEGHRFVIEFNDTGVVTDYGELGQWATRYHARRASDTSKLPYPLRIPLGGRSPSAYLTVNKDHYTWENRSFGEITELRIFSEEPEPDILGVALIIKFGSPDLERIYLSPGQRKRFEERGIRTSVTVVWIPVLLECLAQLSPDVEISVVDRRWYHDWKDTDEE